MGDIPITVGSIKDNPDFACCPRCRRYHRSIRNHDGLCDRCCAVLVEMKHECADAIRAAYQAQSEHYQARVPAEGQS